MRRVRKELIVAAAAVAALAGVTKADTSLFTTQSDFTVGPNEADGQNNVGNAGWEPSNNNISANTFTGTLVSGASGDTDGSTVNGVGNFIGGTYQGGQTSAAGAMTVQNLAGGATTGTSSNWCPFNSENEAYSTTTGGTTTYTTNTAFFNALGITSAQEYGSENSNTPHGTIAVDFTEPVSPTHVGTFFETQFIFNDDYDGYNQLGLVNAKQPAQGGGFTVQTGYTVQTGPNSYTMYQNWSLPYGVANDGGGTQIAYTDFQVIMLMNTDYAGGSVTFDNIRTTNGYSVWSGSGTGSNNFSNASFWNQTPKYSPSGSVVNPYTTGGNLAAGNKIVFSGGTHTSGSYTYQVGNPDPGIPNGTPTPQAVTNDLVAGASYEGIVFDDSQNNGGATSTSNTVGTTTTVTYTTSEVEYAYTIGGASINLMGDIVNDSSVGQIINLPLVLQQNTNINAFANSLSLGGNISGASYGLNIPAANTGITDSVTLSGTNTYGGNTTLASGMTLNISGDGSLSPNTTLLANGTVNVAASSGIGVLNRSVNGITLTSTGSVLMANPTVHANRTVLVTTGLSFGGATGAWQGLVDLSGNDLIVKGGGAASLANVTNQLKEGFNAHVGYWNGTAGIISSAAAADTKMLTTLGSMQPTTAGTFDGVSTASSDVIVKYTYYGDANLDGSVNGADYQQIDLGFGSHLTGWQNGDFNYDGVVDGSDFSLIDNTFNQINASGASALALIASSADLAVGPQTPVPEPTTLTLLGMGAVGLLGRRRTIRKITAR